MDTKQIDEELTLSSRGLNVLTSPNMIRECGAKALKNPYHPTENPEGIVFLGKAENFLIEEMCLERLRQPDMEVITPAMLHYFNYVGDSQFREAICRFLTKYFVAAEQLNPNNVILTSGVGAAVDMLATLLTEPGDYFLNIAPYYSGLKSDFASRGQTQLLDVYLNPETFQSEMTDLDVKTIINKLESVLLNAKKEGKVIKGIIVVNPHNPIGYVMPLKFIRGILHFANKYDIHVVMDEIYAMTVFDDDVTFESVLKIKDIPNKQKTHFVWGFSKDFGLAGVRCGVIYTWNKGIKQCASSFLYFGSVPLIVQHKLQTMISDFDWLDMFFKEHQRLMKMNCDFCAGELDRMNIPYIKPQAAYFLWINLSKFLSEKSPEAELALFQQLLDGGVFFLPGQYQSSPEPGWFRVTFVSYLDHMKAGFANLEKVISSSQVTSKDRFE